MEKKTKAPKSAVDHNAAIQEAITKVQLTEVERLQTQIATSLGLAEAAVAGLRTIEESVSRIASSLRHLLAAQEHRRSPSQGKGAVPAGRNDVDGALPAVPRSHSSKRRVESYKRLPHCPAIKDLTQFSGI